MPEVHYSGTKQSAADVSYALTRAGYSVMASTPDSPRASTEFWLQARELFEPAALQQGDPRDYRALLRDPQGGTRLLRVHLGGTIRADESAAVTVSAPPAVSRRASGLSVWQNAQSGQMHNVFAWDGTDLGFADLVAFFQLNGNLLNRLNPVPDAQGFPVLQGTATVLQDGHVYEFEMTQRSRFTVSGTGTIQTLTEEELHAGYRPVR